MTPFGSSQRAMRRRRDSISFVLISALAVACLVLGLAPVQALASETTPSPSPTSTTATPGAPDSAPSEGPTDAPTTDPSQVPSETPTAATATDPAGGAPQDRGAEADEDRAAVGAAQAVPPGAADAVGTAGNLGREYYLSNSLTSKAEIEFVYGRTNDEVLVGDWDGDGKDTLAVRRGRYYFFKNSIGAGGADLVIAYGRPGDTVLVGDWDGDGKDTLAVRRGNTYHLLNSLRGGQADVVFSYGRTTDTVLVGDWDGDGVDSLAVRRASTYYVKNSFTAGNADRVLSYGRPSDQVYAGDWDGNGTDTFAVRRGSTFYFRNSLSGGPADRQVTFGRADDMVLVGDWDGNGTDTLGLRRPPPKPAPVQTVFMFDIQWAGQPNNFFCGPTSGFMVLRYLGAGRSKATGASLTIENVATAMSTRAYGYTSFHDRKFEIGMNAWLGRMTYTTLHTPSPATVQEEVRDSFRVGLPVVVDEQERRGGPHFNGHANSTFSHIMVVTGYDTQSDAVQFADPGATLWPGAAQKFWYPSLAEFTRTYLEREYVNDGRQHIGIFTG